MDAIIAVDAGGTQIRAALFEAGAKHIAPLKIHRSPTRSKPKAFDTLTAAIEEVLAPGDARARHRRSRSWPA